MNGHSPWLILFGAIYAYFGSIFMTAIMKTNRRANEHMNILWLLVAGLTWPIWLAIVIYKRGAKR